MDIWSIMIVIAIILAVLALLYGLYCIKSDYRPNRGFFDEKQDFYHFDNEYDDCD